MATVEVSLTEEGIGAAKRRFDPPEETPVVSCYEASRQGFWLHRHLVAQGVESHVVDSSSIEDSRKVRRRKTDKLDAKRLLKVLVRYGPWAKRTPGAW